MEAALWLAGELGLSADELQSFEPDAEAVIRTSLLVLATHGQELPDWIGFEKMIVAMRQKGSTVVGAALQLPKGLPDDYRDAVEAVRQSVLADLPKLTQTRISVRKLFDQTPAFMGRYFWIEDALSDVGQYDRARSVAWNKFTRDHDDDGTLLTLLLCVATGVAAKPLLTQKAATGLIRKIRRTGWQPELASNYIKEHAPAQHQDDYARLWHDFVDEAQATLLSEHDGRLTDALALLRRDCNVS
ncbi:hypothetical protein GALL_527970 [mine drainage metagenome]|uniref:Uncharacterized protein n=1 Tax=mine drainage metagenome TaxID=410659 RepID=A0A1J5PK19_9ZZZZ